MAPSAARHNDQDDDNDDDDDDDPEQHVSDSQCTRSGGVETTSAASVESRTETQN